MVTAHMEVFNAELRAIRLALDLMIKMRLIPKAWSENGGCP